MTRRDPFDLIGVQNNILNRSTRLERKMDTVARRNVVANYLRKFSGEMGEMDFRAVDDNGLLRVIMSAIDIFEELGIHAHFAGFDTNGVVQFYASADDGKLYGGGGAVILDMNGIILRSDANPGGAYIIWKTATGEQIGDIVADFLASSLSGIALSGRAKSASEIGNAALQAEDESGTVKGVLAVRTDGQAIANLEDGTNNAAGQQALTVKTKVTATAGGNTVLYLQSKSTGTPGVGFGSFQEFRIENVPKDEVLTGGALGYVYEIATDDLEKSRLENFRLYGGAAIRVPVHEPDYRWIQPIESDFIGDNGGLEPVAFGGGGTVAAITGEADHPGITRISSAAVNNTGGSIRLVAPDGSTGYNDAIVVGGGEIFYCVFRLGSIASQVVSILGYSDATGAATAPTDGMWINIAAATLTGKTANNTTISTTGTSYTVATGTWYRCVVMVSTNGATVYFYLYNATTGALLWSDTLTTNIPSGRATGYLSKAYRTNNVATDILDVDWMAYYNVKQFAR